MVAEQPEAILVLFGGYKPIVVVVVGFAGGWVICQELTPVGTPGNTKRKPREPTTGTIAHIQTPTSTKT